MARRGLRKLLIANRGEIALRIIRSARLIASSLRSLAHSFARLLSVASRHRGVSGYPSARR